MESSDKAAIGLTSKPGILAWLFFCFSYFFCHADVLEIVSDLEKDDEMRWRESNFLVPCAGRLLLRNRLYISFLICEPGPILMTECLCGFSPIDLNYTTVRVTLIYTTTIRQ